MASPLASPASTPSPKGAVTVKDVGSSLQLKDTICLNSRAPEAFHAAFDRSTSPTGFRLRPSISASSEQELFSVPGPFQPGKPPAGTGDLLIRTAGGAVHRVRASIERLEPSPSLAFLQQQKAIIERYSKNRHLVAPCISEQSSTTLHAALGLLPRWADIEGKVTELDSTESRDFIKDTYTAIFELSRLIELSSLGLPLHHQQRHSSDASSELPPARESPADPWPSHAQRDPRNPEETPQPSVPAASPAPPQQPSRPSQCFQRQSATALSFPQFISMEGVSVTNEQIGNSGFALIAFMQDSDTSLASAHRVAFEETRVDKSKAEADNAGFKNVNHYTLLEEIGRGMFGKVYLAANVASGEAVAIKVMDCNVKVPKHRFGQATAKAALAKSMGLAPPPLAESDSLVLREIAIMKRLNHKNIVMLKEVIHDEEEELVYMVMQYVDNGPIAKLSEDGTCGRLTVDQVRSFLRQSATGLQYLHNHGIIHRDIKPENILWSSEGVCCLADFGVSAVVRDGHTVDFAAGTQTFFSPEMCRGRADEVQRFAKESDIWALGVTFYAVRFGRLPFYSTNVLDLCDKIQNGPLTFPDNECPADDSIRELLSRMLAKDPKDRISLSALRKHPYLRDGDGQPLKSEDSEMAFDIEPPVGFEETVIRKASGRSVFAGGRSCASRSSTTAPFHGLDSVSISTGHPSPHFPGTPAQSLDREEWLVSESEWTALPRGPIEFMKFRKIAMADQKNDETSVEVTVVTQPKPNGSKTS